jgi:hypothetical protein
MHVRLWFWDLNANDGGDRDDGDDGVSCTTDDLTNA